MIDSKVLRTVQACQAPAGSIAWISDYFNPVLVLASPGGEEEGNQFTSFLDLGGDQPFGIWAASEAGDATALALSDFRLEVDIASRSAMHSLNQRVGHAFVTPESRGLIGSVSRGFGSLRNSIAITVAGERAKISQDSCAVSFERWRIVHGDGDAIVPIYEHGAIRPASDL